MEKEISCTVSRFFLDYIREHSNDDCSGLLKNLDPEIDALPDPESYLKDPNNWISCSVASKLYKRARLVLGDDMAAYKITKYAVEKTSLGYVQGIIVKAFWSYKKALKHVQKINDIFNRTKRAEIVEIKGNQAIVRLHWYPEMGVTKDMCLINHATYTFMPLIWGGTPLSFREECCYFEGAPYCEYHLKWPARNRLYEIFSRFFASRSVLMETINEMEEDKKLVEQKYEEVNRLNVELNYKIQQLLAIQDTGKAILSVLDLGKLLDVIMNILSNVCRINRALIMLVNEEEGYLEYIHGVGFGEEISDDMRNYKVPLDRVNNMLVRVTNTGQAEYIPEVESSTLRKENMLLAQAKPIAIYVAPLITRSKVIGVIATDAVDGKGVPEDTRKTLDVFSPQIAIAIENAKLYRKLKEQMRELKQSHRLLNRAEKLSFLGNLAARLAHEIKNPMTAIGTFIQMLPQHYDDKEFRENFHKVAMEETDRVNNLITELLDLVSIKESHFEFSDLHGLIDKMILLVSPQSNSKKINVVRKFDSQIGHVWIDSEKMKQVVLNILSNAVEFTPEKGKIEIITTGNSVNGNKKSVRVEIRDNGIGISQSAIDKVFDPYFTTKQKSTIHHGTGLGLFIAHQNMQDHGGTIEVKSKADEGTTFILALPVDPS
jgi:signal transduction histidine kinase